MTAVLPGNPSPEPLASSSSETRAAVNHETISDTTTGLIDPNWALSTESLEPFLDNFSGPDLPDPGLEYAYHVGNDYTLTNFDGSQMDMAFGTNAFTP